MEDPSDQIEFQTRAHIAALAAVRNLEVVHDFSRCKYPRQRAISLLVQHGLLASGGDI